MNVVQPGHSLYAGIFRNPEIVKVFSEKVALIALNYSAVSRRRKKHYSVLHISYISHLDLELRRICNLGKEVDTKNKHICIGRPDCDPAFLSLLFLCLFVGM
jgi:hypothetical protein